MSRNVQSLANQSQMPVNEMSQNYEPNSANRLEQVKNQLREYLEINEVKILII